MLIETCYNRFIFFTILISLTLMYAYISADKGCGPARVRLIKRVLPSEKTKTVTTPLPTDGRRCTWAVEEPYPKRFYLVQKL
jgi:hypothetical protein